MKLKQTNAGKLKKDLRARKVFGLAVDIDDTLSYTDYYWFEWMRLKFANPEKLALGKLIKKYKRFDNVPYWQSQKAGKFINKLFHSAKFHESIPLVKGANLAIRKIHGLVPIAVYITGRPASVYAPTKKWLERHSFPDAPIILLPKNISQKERHLWKARLLKVLYPEVVGIIEDHPSFKKELEAVKYKGKLFLYDNGLNEKNYHHRSARFKNWKDIIKAVSGLLQRSKS